MTPYSEFLVNQGRESRTMTQDPEAVRKGTDKFDSGQIETFSHGTKDSTESNC